MSDIVRDGETLRVHFDGTTEIIPSSLTQRRQAHDANWMNNIPGEGVVYDAKTGHRLDAPKRQVGYRQESRCVQREALARQRNAAHENRCIALSEAWRRPFGSAGHVQSSKISSPPVKLTGDHAADREEIHRRRCAYLENAWKS